MCPHMRTSTGRLCPITTAGRALPPVQDQGSSADRVSGRQKGLPRSRGRSPREAFCLGLLALLLPAGTVTAREPAALLKGHGSTVNAVAFSPDGKVIATAGSDKV